jgi:small subunit ribosomal protein S11
MLAKCLPTFIVATTTRSRLFAFMSTMPDVDATVRSLLLSTSTPADSKPPSPSHAIDDKHPPKAPADSYPRSPPINPITARRTFGLATSEKLVYHLHWKSTRHNTVATLTNNEGKIQAWATGGSCGFKHTRRGEYEAGYQVATKMFKKIEEQLLNKSFKLELIYEGFGQGRQALDSALLTTEGHNIRPLLIRLTDRTPLKIGGTRAKKARRL